MDISIDKIILRFLFAVIIGGIIGFERETKNRSAGLRTHILVCIGATMVSMLQIEMANKAIEVILENDYLKDVIKIDYGRLGAQVITGVGFIGAGTIIHNKGSVQGLTTAATLWLVACIGLCIGMGEYYISVLGGLIAFLSLVFLKDLEDKYITKYKVTTFKVFYLNEKIKNMILEVLTSKNIKILSIENDCEKKEVKEYVIIISFRKPGYIKKDKLKKEMLNINSEIVVEFL